MKKIYRVYGEQGEYSNYYTWTVACFTTKEIADFYAENYNENEKNNSDRSEYCKHYFYVEEAELYE